VVTTTRSLSCTGPALAFRSQLDDRPGRALVSCPRRQCSLPGLAQDGHSWPPGGLTDSAKGGRPSRLPRRGEKEDARRSDRQTSDGRVNATLSLCRFENTGVYFSRPWPCNQPG